MIVMEIQSADLANHPDGTYDSNFKRIVVAANARPEPYQGSWPEGTQPSSTSLCPS